jgi:hypothetical protein
MPIYIWDLGQPDGNFYGFPEQIGYPGSIKVALHFTKSLGDSSVRRHPSQVERLVRDEEVTAMRHRISRKIPLMNGKLKASETCMYTMTPDENL